VANVDYKELKKGGFMKQVDKDRFSLRLRIVGGQIKAEQLAKVNEIAQKIRCRLYPFDFKTEYRNSVY